MSLDKIYNDKILHFGQCYKHAAYFKKYLSGHVWRLSGYSNGLRDKKAHVRKQAGYFWKGIRPKNTCQMNLWTGIRCGDP